jgi:hypothetical protein
LFVLSPTDVPYFLLSIIHCAVTVNPIQLCILLHVQNLNCVIGLLPAGIVCICFGPYILVHVPYFLLSIIHCVVTINLFNYVFCFIFRARMVFVGLGLFVFVLAPKMCLTVLYITVLLTINHSLHFPLPL